jgi:nitrogen regulatory protein P-II 1
MKSTKSPNHEPGPESNGSGHLLICVVSSTSKVNEIVNGFVGIGVTGATVIDTHGMAEIAAEQVPVFAGFRQLIQGDRRANRTIFSVIDDDETLEQAMKLVEESCGNLDEPATGIMFVVPVSRVKGIALPVE